MVEVNAIIINTEHKVLAHIETMVESEQEFLNFMDLDNPRWYPIPGGWMVVNQYSTQQSPMMQMVRGHGFEFMGTNHWSNAIFLRGTEQNQLERYIQLDELTSSEDFMAQEIMDNTEFYEMVLDKVTFVQAGYDPALDLGLGIEE